MTVVLPRRMPLFGEAILDSAASGSLVVVLLKGALILLVWKLSARSKLVVLRRRNKTLAKFVAVRVRCFATREEAEAAEDALRHGWAPGQFASAKPLGWMAQFRACSG